MKKVTHKQKKANLKRAKKSLKKRIWKKAIKKRLDKSLEEDAEEEKSPTPRFIRRKLLRGERA